MKYRLTLVLAAAAIIVLAVLTISLRPPLAGAQNPRTLYWGNSGGDVATLQTILRNWGYYTGPVDAYLGPSTWSALKNFQAKNGLRVDGIAGPQTWAALGIPIVTEGGAGTRARAPSAAPAPVATPAYTPTIGVSGSDDLALLARVIAAEAGSEPYPGQVAVGSVILNRIGDPAFPHSLSGVIFEPHAFESVSNGLVWRVSDLESPTRAAQDALNGWDPTYGARFFWNPSKPVSAWIWSRQVVVTIGRHVFAL